MPNHSGEATHALAFMLGGVSTRWKQTVAYHFTGNSVDGAEFKPMIVDILKQAKDVGLHVTAVTSDMGSSNRALWRSFGVVSSKFSMTVNKIPHPVEDGRFLHFLADVPHIIKNTKAALENGNDITLGKEVVVKFSLTSNKVTLNHVKMLHDFQKDKDLKLAPKLTDSLLSPSHFGKMKVSNALYLFSHAVSSALRYLVDAEGYEPNLLTTAWFLDYMRKWFDLMSSRHPIMALSQHNQDAYEDAITHLHTTLWLMRNVLIGEKGHWKPVQAGVVLSTSSILDLQSELLSRGHSFVLTSRFSQDCLENLFGCIRIKNPVPTALQFKQALKCITVAQFLKCPSHSSYEEDDRAFLAEFLDQPSVTKPKTTQLEIKMEDVPSFSGLVDAERSSLHDVAGYCVNKVLKRRKTCSHCVTAVKEVNPKKGLQQTLTTLKQYKEGCLVFCTEECWRPFEKAEQLFRASEGSFFWERQSVVSTCTSS